MRRFRLGLSLGLLLLSVPVGAEVYRAGALEVAQPWARETAATQKNGVAYLTLRNGGDAPDRLVAAESAAAERAELHRHEIDAQGVAMMRQVPGIDVPPGDEVSLRPGALHIMLIGLRRPLAKGARFPLTLQFERAGRVEVQVMVEGVQGPAHDRHGPDPAMPKTH